MNFAVKESATGAFFKYCLFYSHKETPVIFVLGCKGVKVVP